jgi:thioredoxin reductase (NADPH)
MVNKMTITIYSKNNCVYCSKAKALIKGLGLEYEEKSLEKDFGGDPSKLIEDIGKNVRAMPQIKIDGELIGGYNQLVEYFEKQNKVNFKGEIIAE